MLVLAMFWQLSINPNMIENDKSIYRIRWLWFCVADHLFLYPLCVHAFSIICWYFNFLFILISSSIALFAISANVNNVQSFEQCDLLIGHTLPHWCYWVGSFVADDGACLCSVYPFYRRATTAARQSHNF